MTYILVGYNEQFEIDEAVSHFGAPKVVVCDENINTGSEIHLQGKMCLTAEYGDRLDYSRITPELSASLAGCQIQYYRMIDQTAFEREFNFRVNSFYKHVAAWSALLDGVSFVIFGNIPHGGYDWVLYNLARLRGVQCFMFYQMPVRPGLPTLKYAVTDCMNHADSALRHSFDDSITRHVKTYFDGYTRSIDQGYTPFTRKKSSFMRLADKMMNADWSDPLLPVSKALSRTTYKIYKSVFHDAYSSTAYSIPRGSGLPPLDRFETILYYPLHYQPEASTSPLGGHFVEQDLLVKMVAACMDDSMCLIVKDHPRRSLKSRYHQFFQDIKALPRVYLVSSDDHGVDYIARADALIGISGTSCWEALFLGKPVLMAGARIFENAPNVFKVDGPDTISNALKAIDSFKLNSKQREKYFESLTSLLFPGIVSHLDRQWCPVSSEESIRLCMEIINANLNV